MAACRYAQVDSRYPETDNSNMQSPQLDPDAIAAWPGKTIDGTCHPALWHMLDVGAVADCLITHRPITDRLDWNQAMVFLVALHDLGKISESFRDQITGRASRAEYHSQLSFVLLEEHDALLEQILGGKRTSRRALYAAIAGHHGGPPELDGGDGNSWRRWKSAIGHDAFEVAARVISAVAILFPQASLEGLASRKAKTLSWLVSGLTVQSDWIGSNTDWFGQQPATIPIPEYWRQARQRADKAVASAGLHHAEPRACAAILPVTATPRPMQEAVQQVALPQGPSMVLIEDATGAGKTEAALMLASRMMAAEKGDGLFFALPTMATSNAMLTRIKDVAAELFSGHPSLGLSHGRAGQNELFRTIRGSDGSDPAEPVTCGQWLADDRRRILLADIGVGTIDQALLAVLPTRFNTLRLWGVSNKILIVDEAHSYDPYMKEELSRLLWFHAMFGGSAIVMTATLPKAMRNDYAYAFQRGLGIRQPERIEDDAYPQLTMVSHQVDSCQPDPVPATCRDIAIHRIDEQKAIALVRDGVAKGAACVWIRNAVDDAVAAVQALKAEGVAADLLHARFMAADRVAKEEVLQARFGRGEGDRQGRVLVATQVIEASLDLDFDLMISDLAPIGSMIQRAGRLWRHMDERPVDSRPVAGPALHIVSPDPYMVEDARWLHRMLKSGAWVYPLATQWRTARVLFDARVIRAPGGLRHLIEAVHGPALEEVPSALESAKQEADGRSMIERQMARNQLLKPDSYLDAAQKVHDEEKVMTRLGVRQVTLWLARTGAGGLEPLADSWEESEVRMSHAQYEKLGGVDQERSEIATLKASWPEWKQASIWIAPVGLAGEISERLRYDATCGLVVSPYVGMNR